MNPARFTEPGRRSAAEANQRLINTAYGVLWRFSQSDFGRTGGDLKVEAHTPKEEVLPACDLSSLGDHQDVPAPLSGSALLDTGASTGNLGAERAVLPARGHPPSSRRSLLGRVGSEICCPCGFSVDTCHLHNRNSIRGYWPPRGTLLGLGCKTTGAVIAVSLAWIAAVGNRAASWCRDLGSNVNDHQSSFAWCFGFGAFAAVMIFVRMLHGSTPNSTSPSLSPLP